MDTVAVATGTTKAEASKAVGAVLDAIRDGLQRGDKVALAGFGSFETAPPWAAQGPQSRSRPGSSAS